MPAAYGPMYAVTEKDTNTISLMCCTQLMKTELLLNVIGWAMDENPVPMLFVLPTVDLAKSISKDRVKKMLRDTPVLRGKVESSRSRESDNTLVHMEYPGGALDLVGANAPGDLASRPKAFIICDEIDKYPKSAGKEGDPMKLAEERAARWWNRKFIRTCSPTDEKTSRIWREYQQSDQRKLFLRCPHCDERQTLGFKENVKWGKDEYGNHQPDTAAIMCGHCGCLWDEKERRNALDEIASYPDYGWRQTAEFFCCGNNRTPEMWNEKGRSLCPECGKESAYNGHAGFQASKLHDKMVHLPDLVRKFLAVVKAKSREEYQTFVNTQLAEPFVSVGETLSAETLLNNREMYKADVPLKVNTLTAGIDQQDQYLVCEVVGWASDEESWSIAYEIFEGDTNTDEPWDRLDEFLQSPHVREDGRLMYVEGACVDTGGHATQRAYNFCNERRGRRVWPIKGVALNTRGERSPIWPTSVGRQKGRDNSRLYMVGVAAAKDIIYSRLQLDESGPGYMHFPEDRELWYFEQLTAEHLVMGEWRGRQVTVWEKVSRNRANEALDCRVYAMAALQGLVMMHKWRLDRDHSVAPEVTVTSQTGESVIVPTKKPREASPYQDWWD